jgi:hypothetical protein
VASIVKSRGFVVATIVASAAFLAVVSVGAAVIALHDLALAGGGVGLKLGSAALVAIAAVIGIGAVQLATTAHRRAWPNGARPTGKPSILLAFLLSTLVGVYVFVSGAPNGGPQRAFVVVAAFVLALVGLGGLLFFGRGVRLTRPRVGTVALGLIGTLAGAAGQFWYVDQYSPSHAGRGVTLDVTLRREAVAGQYDVIRVAIDYAAAGQRSVAVVGSTYTLTGSRVVRCERKATAEAVAGVFSGALPDPQRSRFMADVWELQPSDVLAAGKFVGDGKRLDPGVPASREIVFLARRGRHQLLRFRAQLFAVPASAQLSQREDPTFKRFDDDNRVYGFFHIDDDSWIRDLLYGRERWVVVRYALVQRAQDISATPDLRVIARFPDATWSRDLPNEKHVVQLFAGAQGSDASEPFADSELLVGKIDDPSAADSVPATCRRTP